MRQKKSFPQAIGYLSRSGLTEFGAFYSNGDMYLMPSNPLTDFLNDLHREEAAAACKLAAYFVLIDVLDQHRWGGTFDISALDRMLDTAGLSFIRPYLGTDFGQVMAMRNSRIFNPFAWDRRAEE